MADKRIRLRYKRRE